MPVEKSKIFGIRFTPEEYALVIQRAASSGLKPSEYIRRCVFARATPDKSERKALADLTSLHALLRKQGGLLKHTATETPGNVQPAINAVEEAAKAITAYITANFSD